MTTLEIQPLTRSTHRPEQIRSYWQEVGYNALMGRAVELKNILIANGQDLGGVVRALMEDPNVEETFYECFCPTECYFLPDGVKRAFADFVIPAKVQKEFENEEASDLIASDFTEESFRRDAPYWLLAAYLKV